MHELKFDYCFHPDFWNNKTEIEKSKKVEQRKTLLIEVIIIILFEKNNKKVLKNNWKNKRICQASGIAGIGKIYPTESLKSCPDLTRER